MDAVLCMTASFRVVQGKAHWVAGIMLWNLSSPVTRGDWGQHTRAVWNGVGRQLGLPDSPGLDVHNHDTQWEWREASQAQARF